MSPINKDVRSAIAQTHETAIAMVEDLAHMREIIAKPELTSADIRRLSNPMRRILIDKGGDIGIVARPRIGRFSILAPDIRALIRAGEKHPFQFLSAGSATAFGVTVDALTMGQLPAPPAPQGYTPGQTVQLQLSSFLSQKVLCFQGAWATRADVIKYVANVAHGVHSGTPKEASHELLKRVRYAVGLKVTEGPSGSGMSLLMRHDLVTEADKPIVADRSYIDVVLLQLISAVGYLTTSPDVLHLENIVQNEDTS